MPPVRYFTPDEAARLIPRLRPLLAAVREAWHEQRFAQEQVADMQRMMEETAHDPSHPDHQEMLRWEDAAREAGRRVESLLSETRALGVEVKDPLMGLVDFYARRGGETVLLCYRDDEPELGWWHPLTTGYAGRRPLSEF